MLSSARHLNDGDTAADRCNESRTCIFGLLRLILQSELSLIRATPGVKLPLLANCRKVLRTAC